MSNNGQRNTGAAPAPTVRARASLAVRIVMIVIAVAALAIAVLAGLNVASSARFNQATSTLNANLKLASKDDADLDALRASQQQADAQFEDAAKLDAVLLPQLREAIESNAKVSAELTKRIEQELVRQRGGSGDANDTNNNGTSGELEAGVTDSKDNRKNEGGLTDEQKKQVEDLLKANQQSTDTNPSTNTQTDKGSRKPQTSKPW
ncbi:cell surface protein [Bifidobacterium sp. 64T4]|uniref:DUF6466 family protein n=1 Tax=Bifidobacterium pongonis TaxID=2834432 RepID=UPI001C56195E|nr:DUF6466 family protein [Bifidobacterium pongonis]MBW3094300.1 cell surface protein [Bifidobacterium pongonis]